MKKFFFFAAIAAIGLASCSNDETIASQATNESNAISFRPIVNGTTRANDQTQTALQQSGKGFYVTAKHNATASQEGGSDYFDNAHYTYYASSYTCSDKYYWPGSGYLNFYAYAPAVKANEIDRTAYNTFTITPNVTAAQQEDFIYAVAYDQTKAQNGAGVTLNFHHAQSKVSINAKNTSTMAFTIGDVHLYQVNTTGTFTYTNAATNISAGKLVACWSSLSGSGSYSHSPGTTSFAAGTTSTSPIATDMILIPQTITPVAGYSSASAGAALATTGSFIQIQIKATQGGQYVVGDANTFVNAIWPLPAGTWLPGYHYTYTVDLGGGGYYATSQDNTDTTLDPIIAGSEIIFTTVTVDDWTDAAGINIPNP